MAVSSVGLGPSITAIRHAVATVLVFVGLFFLLYGPPLTDRLRDAAARECNAMTGSAYRNYRLEWRTTTLSSVHAPHWVCFDLRDPARTGTSLGWWVDL
jgi:hypothetical protein